MTMMCFTWGTTNHSLIPRWKKTLTLLESLRSWGFFQTLKAETYLKLIRKVNMNTNFSWTLTPTLADSSNDLTSASPTRIPTSKSLSRFPTSLNSIPSSKRGWKYEYIQINSNRIKTSAGTLAGLTFNIKGTKSDQKLPFWSPAPRTQNLMKKKFKM